jgi:hypothetical protein
MSLAQDVKLGYLQSRCVKSVDRKMGDRQFLNLTMLSFVRSSKVNKLEADEKLHGMKGVNPATRALRSLISGISKYEICENKYELHLTIPDFEMSMTPLLLIKSPFHTTSVNRFWCRRSFLPSNKVYNMECSRQLLLIFPFSV